VQVRCQEDIEVEDALLGRNKGLLEQVRPVQCSSFNVDEVMGVRGRTKQGLFEEHSMLTVQPSRLAQQRYALLGSPVENTQRPTRNTSNHRYVPRSLRPYSAQICYISEQGTLFLTEIQCIFPSSRPRRSAVLSLESDLSGDDSITSDPRMKTK
jgi:hypothetical protein